MKTKILLSTALLALSGSVYATTLTFNGTHAEKNQVEEHFFNVTGGGDVAMIVDTLSDGFDAHQALWIKAGADWALAVENQSPGAPRPFLPGDAGDTGVNDFGVALKNGYVKGDPLQPGLSDPGVVEFLEAGMYKITTSGNGNFPAGGKGDLESAIIWTEQDSFENESFFHGPHDYTFTVSGDFVTAAAVVPVPAAVWLFGSAIAGLGAIRRKRAIAA